MKNTLIIVMILSFLGCKEGSKTNSGSKTDGGSTPVTFPDSNEGSGYASPVTSSKIGDLEPTYIEGGGDGFETGDFGTGEANARFFVSPSGKESNDGKSAQKPFYCIQTAIDRAGPGSIIELAPGTYRQRIVTRRDGTKSAPIIIRGPRAAVLTGGTPYKEKTSEGTDCNPLEVRTWRNQVWKREVSRVVRVFHDHFHLEGFTIDGYNKEQKPNLYDSFHDQLIYGMGTKLVGQAPNPMQGLLVKNMKITNAGGECIRIKYFAQYNTIIDNELSFCGTRDFGYRESATSALIDVETPTWGDDVPTSGYCTVPGGTPPVYNTGSRVNGEGVYIGSSGGSPPEKCNQAAYNPTPEVDDSSFNIVRNNIIHTWANECVEVKEGGHDNLVEGNECAYAFDPEAAGFASRGDRNIFRGNYIFAMYGAGFRPGGHEAAIQTCNVFDNNGICKNPIPLTTRPLNNSTWGSDNEFTGNFLGRSKDGKTFGYVAFGAVKIQVSGQRKVCGNTLEAIEGKSIPLIATTPRIQAKINESLGSKLNSALTKIGAGKPESGVSPTAACTN